MAYDTDLAARVRAALLRARARARATPHREIKMSGGLCFMVSGHMCCGVAGQDLIVRVGPERPKDALALPNPRPVGAGG